MFGKRVPVKEDFLAATNKYVNENGLKYRAESIVRKHGIEIIRLPPYHPEFNAIGTYNTF